MVYCKNNLQFHCVWRDRYGEDSPLWCSDFSGFGVCYECRCLGIFERLSIASGFKLIYHGDETLFIEGDWAGTLFAPKAKLVLGQAKKFLYGRFVGNGITVHQYASLYVVHFDPQTKMTIAYFNMEEK